MAPTKPDVLARKQFAIDFKNFHFCFRSIGAKEPNIGAHSWFATVVDGNELGPVQLNKLKYEDP